jgi:hypothetical protein
LAEILYLYLSFLKAYDRSLFLLSLAGAFDTQSIKVYHLSLSSLIKHDLFSAFTPSLIAPFSFGRIGSGLSCRHLALLYLSETKYATPGTLTPTATAITIHHFGFIFEMYEMNAKP